MKYPETKRITNFDKDLKDGLVFAELINCYCGKIDSVKMELKGLKV